MMMMNDIKKLYKEKLKIISEQEFEKNQIVLIGDCLIENLNIDKYFPDLKIYNNGISGDTAQMLLGSLYKRAIKYRPSKLFLSVGSKDMGMEDHNIKDIYNNIIMIVEETKRRLKNTEIHIMSIIPVNPANMENIAREHVDARDNYDINLLNGHLRRYARRNNYKFVDISKSLRNDFQQLNIDYTLDGFHLNELGYTIVSNLIREFV